MVVNNGILDLFEGILGKLRYINLRVATANSLTIDRVLPYLVNSIVRGLDNESILLERKGTLDRKTNILMTLTNRPKDRSKLNLILVELVANENLLTTVTIKPTAMSRPMMNMKRLATISNPLSNQTSLTDTRRTINPDTRRVDVGIASSLDFKARDVAASSREDVDHLRRNFTLGDSLEEELRVEDKLETKGRLLMTLASEGNLLRSVVSQRRGIDLLDRLLLRGLSEITEVNSRIERLDIRPKPFKTEARGRPINFFPEDIDSMKVDPNTLVTLLDDEPLLKGRKGDLKVSEELVLRKVNLRIGEETSTVIEAIGRGGNTTL